MINSFIGTYNFKEVKSSGNYIDKTEFINYIIRYLNSSAVLLFTRPRRFGKSLMISCLDYFFNKDYKDTRYLFDDLKIASCPSYKEINSHLVIKIDFKNCIDEDYQETINKTYNVLSDLVHRYDFIKDLSSLSSSEANCLNNIRLNKASKNDYELCIYALCKLISNYLKEKPILLIDEYDAQMNHGYSYGYLDKIQNFFKNFYGYTLKGNDYISVA